MLKPQLTHHHQFHDNEQLEEVFSLICWNVHKETQTKAFENYLHEISHHYDADLLLFQEAKTDHHVKLPLKGYSYILAPNIQTKKALFGVMTAAKSRYYKHKTYLTTAQESLWATHKSALFTHHLLPNKDELLIVNIHAINFMPNFWFKKELDILQAELSQHQGPLIVAGDFNTWNKKRMQYLKDFAQICALSFANIEEEHHVKSMIRHKLDHVLYRGLILQHAVAINSGKLSDHNPIYVTFGQI